jgi:hypothetical protein
MGASSCEPADNLLNKPCRPRPSCFFCQQAREQREDGENLIVETVPVIERFQGQTVWEGEVGVFDLSGHPKASRGDAWAYDQGK